MENTPFDSLDFASVNIGLGGRLAIDATTKIGPEKKHEWGEPLNHSNSLKKSVDESWNELGLSDLEEKEADPSLFGYVLNEVIKLNQITNS